jgi:Fic family protein
MNPFKPKTLPLESLDWRPFIRLIGQANAALARYDGTLQGMVNPEILLSPLTTQEAVLSSRIEGTRTTLAEVLEYEASKGKKSNNEADIQEVINYRQALQVAVDELKNRPISLNMLRRIHEVLLHSVRGQSSAPGEFRRIQNWIGRPGSTIETATYVPPDPSQIMPSLSNLEHYIHHNEEDHLVQLAIVHAQFEIIHPFIDGNGRVGRILIPLFLYEKNLLSQPLFYLSEYLESHRDAYYDHLLAITDSGNWQGWIQYFLTCVREQAQINTSRAQAILALYNKMKIEIPNYTRSLYTIQILDTLFDQPIFSTTDFVEKLGIPKRSAIRILERLREEKIIEMIQEGRGRQPNIISFPSLLKIVQT